MCRNATTTTTYGWYDGAVQTYVSHQRDIGTGSWTGTYSYDVWGTLYQANISDGRARVSWSPSRQLRR